MGRFDYVKYDGRAQDNSELFKAAVTELETMTEKHLPNGRSKALALTALEEFFMWVGKAIRDDQIARNGSAPLMEERKDG